MRVLLRPEAEIELLEAQAWYEQRSQGLGLEFARAVEAAINAAVRNPTAYPPIQESYRRIILRRFPYAIIYYHDDNEMVIVACYHQSRKPRSWRDRVD